MRLFNSKEYILKWLYWIPFAIIAVSFYIYFFEFFSSNPTLFNGAREQNPSYIYFRYLTYFFLLSTFLAQALFKTIGLSKLYTQLFSIIIVSIPLLIFRSLVLTHYGYTELINIFYEVAFIVFGFFVLHLFNLVNQKFFKISFKDEDTTALLIIASLVFFWVSQLDNVPITGDTLNLMTAVVNPSASSLDYWIHIFTNPTNDVQYRPISFFVIYYLFRNVFGPVAWPFQCLGMILIVLGGKLFFNLIRETSKNFFLALVGSCFLICHSSVINMMTDSSFIEKYYFPIIVLIFGLLIVKRKGLNQLLYCIVLTLLSVLSIMSHEGSFVFPIVFIFFDFTIYKTLRKQYFLLILPSIIYFLARLFYFKIPSEGFMEVDLLTLINYLPKYLDYVLIPRHFLKFIGTIGWLPNPSMCFFSIFSLVCVFFISKKHYLTISVLFFSIIIILLPFSVLINHFYWNRSVWAIVPTVLLISFIVGNIQRMKIKILFCGIFFAWFLILGHSSILEIKGWKKYIYSQTKIQKQLRLSIAKQLKKGVPAVIYIDSIKVPNPWKHKLLAGFLSLHFPKETFIIKNYKTPMKLFIKNGTYYVTYSEKEKNDWTDPFYYKSKVKLPKKFITIHVDLKMLKSLN